MRFKYLIVTLGFLSLLGIQNVFALSNDISDKKWLQEREKEFSTLNKSHFQKEIKAFAEDAKKSLKKNYDRDEIEWAKKNLFENTSLGFTDKQKKAFLKDLDISHLAPRYERDSHPIPSMLNKSKGDLFIFVSFSMPKKSLKALIKQSKRAGGVLVIRGFIDNSFKKTASVIKDILGDQKGGFEINPPLFRKFNINVVPAFVLVGSGDINSEKTQYDIIYGDISLNAALEKIAKDGEVEGVCKEKAKFYLEKMRNHYD